MYAVSEEYIRAMHRPVQRHKLVGTIGDTSFEESDILSGSFTLAGQCSDTSNVQIGQVYITELKMTLISRQKFDRYTLKGAELIPSFGLRLTSGIYEYVPLGVFTINQASWGASGVEITAYDNMAMFDRAFSTASLTGTPYELAKLACDSCKVELGLISTDFEAFTNGNERLSLYADNNIGSWRDVISWLAQTLAANALIDREGKLVFKAYGREVTDELDNTQRITGASFGDYETRYTGLSCVNIEEQTTSYYGDDLDDGLTYNLGSNPFLQTEVTADVDDMRKAILSALKEIQYVPFKVEMIGNPAYDLMDVFRFTGGLADETKISCMTKYTFKFNDKYSAQGVGQNPELVSAKSKSDKNLAGIMAAVESITTSINHLIYDYNTGPLSVGQQEETVAMLSFYVSQTTDIEGHFLMDYEADQSTHMTIRFYDTNVEELYSPIEVDVQEGRGTVGIPHSFLHREYGIHSAFVTVQCTLGTVNIDTRGVFFTINAGNFATAVDEIAMDIRDISMRQLLESNGPDEIWTVGIEQGNLIASKRPYNITPGKRVEWTGVYTPGKAKTSAIEFDGEWMLKSGADKYTIQTEDQPWYFWVDMDDRLIAQLGDNEALRYVLDTNVTTVAACKGYSSMLYPEQDQGLVCAYVKEGKAYYRQYVYSESTGGKLWAQAVPLSDEDVDDVRVHRLNDYRICFVLSNADHNVWMISERCYVNQSIREERASLFQSRPWEGISVAPEGTDYSGVPVEFDDPKAAQTDVFVDFPYQLAFINKRDEVDDVFSVELNDTAKAITHEDYELSIEGGRVNIHFNIPIVAGRDTESTCLLKMEDKKAYLTGNGVKYRLDEDSWQWTFERLIREYPLSINDSGEVSHSTNVRIISRFVTDMPVPYTEDKTILADPDVLTISRYVTYVPRTDENKADVTAGINVTITVQQVGESPI